MLASFLPAIGPQQSLPVNATPFDRPELTNAQQALSADYIDAQGELMASVLLVKTRGEVYEHSKALCDRAAGANLTRIEQALEPTGQLLRVVLEHPRESLGEYAVEFEFYQTQTGYKLYFAWLDTDYPAPLPGQQVFNIQVWSAIAGHALSLVALLTDPLPLAWSEPGEIPKAYFRNSRSLGDNLWVNVAGTPEDLKTLTLRATYLRETGTMDVQNLDSPVAGLQKIPGMPFTDVTLELVAKPGVIDRTGVSDGAWAVLDDSLGGGFTEIADQSFVCEHISEPLGALSLAGCGQLVANADEVAGLARHIGEGKAPLNLEPYTALGGLGDI